VNSATYLNKSSSSSYYYYYFQFLCSVLFFSLAILDPSHPELIMGDRLKCLLEVHKAYIEWLLVLACLVHQ